MLWYNKVIREYVVLAVVRPLFFAKMTMTMVSSNSPYFVCSETSNQTNPRMDVPPGCWTHVFSWRCENRGTCCPRLTNVTFLPTLPYSLQHNYWKPLLIAARHEGPSLCQFSHEPVQIPILLEGHFRLSLKCFHWQPTNLFLDHRIKAALATVHLVFDRCVRCGCNNVLSWSRAPTPPFQSPGSFHWKSWQFYTERALIWTLMWVALGTDDFLIEKLCLPFCLQCSTVTNYHLHVKAGAFCCLHKLQKDSMLVNTPILLISDSD